MQIGAGCKIIFSTEKECVNQEVRFSGFVVSCRNLGDLLFFVLQDQYGLIQALLQNTSLDRKITAFLVGKKVCIQGVTLIRQQKSTASVEINDVIEIDIKACFLVDKQQNLVLLSEHLALDSHQYLERDEKLQSAIFHSRLYVSMRDFLRRENFLEIDPPFFDEKNKVHVKERSLEVIQLITERGFERHFHFTAQELRLGLSVESREDLLAQARSLLNTVLPHFSLDPFEQIELLSSDHCLSQFGSLLPDFRFPFRIVDLTFLQLFEQHFISCLCLPAFSYSGSHREKMKAFVRKQVGVNVVVGQVKKGKIEGPLASCLSADKLQQLFAYLHPAEEDLLFFSICLTPQLAHAALGGIFSYIKQNQLFALEGQKGGWVEKKESTELATYFLVINGKQVGFCHLSAKHPLYIYGSLVFSLRKFKEIASSASPDALPLHLKRADGSLEVGPLEETIEIFENEEKEEVRALFKSEAPSSSSFFPNSAGLSDLLSRFSMSEKDAAFLIEMLSEKKELILKLPKNELFQFIWSLLGSNHMTDILQNEQARLALKKICDLQIITDYKQMLFLSVRTTLNIASLLSSPKRTSEEVVYLCKLLKMLLNSTPSQFSNLVDCLLVYSEKEKIDEKIGPLFLQAGKKGLTTPHFFRFFVDNFKKERVIEEFISSVKSLYFHVFPNVEIDENVATALFGEKDILCEILYFLFKPVNMDLDSFKFYFSQMKEYVPHLSAANIVCKGRNWDFIEKCYFFQHDLFFLRLYLSKNRASFFAKASSGICTGIDTALFQRPDHFHLNLVDPNESQIVGNVQLYIVTQESKRLLLIRGINPSAHFVTSENVGFLLNAVLQATIQIAENSEIAEVLICPSLGIWHVESSRKEMIAALRILCKTLPITKLQNPFLLFHFASQDKSIDFAYKIWEREGPFLLNPALSNEQKIPC